MRRIRHAVLLALWALPAAVAAQETPSQPPSAAETPPATAPTPAEPGGAAAASSSQASPPAPSVSVRYDKGFELSSSDDEFALKIVGRLQSRYTLEHPDGGEWAHDFQIARARLTLEGHAFGDVGYKFQTEFGKGFVYLRDFYLDKPLVKHDVIVRFGQFKRPYSRQQITSSGNLQFVDRSIVDRFIGAGRDIGVMLHNAYEKSPAGLEWGVGVFNGTGDRPDIACEIADPMTGEIDCEQSNVPDDAGPMIVARAGWNMGGVKGYSESDLEGGPLRLAVGASYSLFLADGESDLFEHRVGPDFMLKVQGLSLTGGAFLVSLPGATERDTDFGFYAQGGYMFVPKRFEIAARFAQVPAGDESKHELLGGLNWFSAGHAWKWQTDAGVLHTTGTDTMDFVLRTQAQLVF